VAFSLGFLLSGVDYDTIGDSSSTVLRAVLLPVGIGALILTAVTSWLDWWRPVMREASPAGPRWLLIIPAVLFAIPVLNMATQGVPARGTEFFIVLAAATLCVGFAEEISTRGLLLTGLRGSVSEVKVWLFTSLTFALLHGLNLFFGQGIGDTLTQVVFAFAIGSVFYAVRRVTGLLVVGMLLHALWDFSIFATDGGAAAATSETVPGLGALLLWPLILLTAYALFRILRSPADES
jgi:membrane protease YdiL (CAAX protease family)